MIIDKISDFSRQCKYLKLEKQSDFKIEKPIQKQLAINLLKGMAKRTPPGSDMVNTTDLWKKGDWTLVHITTTLPKRSACISKRVMELIWTKC